MNEKKQAQQDQVNEILGKYDPEVRKVYQRVLKQEKGVKNIRKDQMKTLIDSEIMAQVNKNGD